MWNTIVAFTRKKLQINFWVQIKIIVIVAPNKTSANKSKFFLKKRGPKMGKETLHTQIFTLHSIRFFRRWTTIFVANSCFLVVIVRRRKMCSPTLNAKNLKIPWVFLKKTTHYCFFWYLWKYIKQIIKWLIYCGSN